MRVAEIYQKAKSLPMKICCVYSITNLINGKRYIGGTQNFKERKGEHEYALRKNKHGNVHLQRAWNIYGPEAFRFSILTVVEEPTSFVGLEQCWLDGYRPEYNIGLFAHASMLGRTFSPEVLAKLSLTRKGKKHSEETKIKIRKALSECSYWSRHIMTPEHRKKISISNTGKIKSPETRAKIGLAHLGLPTSEETRLKLRMANLGKIMPEETKRKISLSTSGRPKSQETRRRMSASWNERRRPTISNLYEMVRALQRCE